MLYSCFNKSFKQQRQLTYHCFSHFQNLLLFCSDSEYIIKAELAGIVSQKRGFNLSQYIK